MKKIIPWNMSSVIKYKHYLNYLIWSMNIFKIKFKFIILLIKLIKLTTLTDKLAIYFLYTTFQSRKIKMIR